MNQCLDLGNQNVLRISITTAWKCFLVDVKVFASIATFWEGFICDYRLHMQLSKSLTTTKRNVKHLMSSYLYSG